MYARRKRRHRPAARRTFWNIKRTEHHIIIIVAYIGAAKGRTDAICIATTTGRTVIYISVYTLILILYVNIGIILSCGGVKIFIITCKRRNKTVDVLYIIIYTYNDIHLKCIIYTIIILSYYYHIIYDSGAVHIYYYYYDGPEPKGWDANLRADSGGRAVSSRSDIILYYYTPYILCTYYYCVVGTGT